MEWNDNPMDDQLKKLYIDMPAWDEPVRVDDFMVAIGKRQSNSVYHIAEVTPGKPRKDKRLVRYYLKVYKSDLITALKRGPKQKLIKIYWYSRDKKRG